MNHIKQFVYEYGTLFMDELFYIYIAKSNKLSISHPDELKNVLYSKVRGNLWVPWEIEDININNLYHPVKDFDTQILFRKKLNESINDSKKKIISVETILTKIILAKIILTMIKK
jgi:hypothetical protein